MDTDEYYFNELQHSAEEHFQNRTKIQRYFQKLLHLSREFCNGRNKGSRWKGVQSQRRLFFRAEETLTQGFYVIYLFQFISVFETLGFRLSHLGLVEIIIWGFPCLSVLIM